MTQEALKLALEFIENSECGTADLEARIKKALAQTQRTWVGLTDEELSILGEKFTHPDEGIDEVDFGMEVQRILKEKNT